MTLGGAVWDAAGRLLRRPGARPVVRALTAVHVALFRRTGGRAQAPAHPTLLLTVTGRRTGRPRTVPLVFAVDGPDLVVAAAYSGSDVDPVWWLNLRDTPQAEVELREDGRTVRRAVRAVVVTDPAERERLWTALVEVYPPFTGYASRTSRVIPVVRLVPAARRPVR